MLTAAAVTGILSVPGGYAFADADTDGMLAGVSDLTSGSTAQAPLQVPVNVCDDGISVAGGYLAGYGDECEQTGTGYGAQSSEPQEEDCESPGPPAPEPESPEPAKPPVHHASTPPGHEPVTHQARTLPAPLGPQLAETGAGPTTLAAGGLAVALLTGGAILYRRGRVAARR